VFINRNNGTKANALGYDVRKSVAKQCETKKIIKRYFKKRDRGFGQCFINRFDKTYKRSKAPAEEKAAWLFYAEQMVNKDQGIDSWLDISARDAFNFRGADQWDQWKDGYDTLLNHLMANVPFEKIKTNTPVCRIYWDDNNRALVVTKAGTSYLAKHVLMTVSIGYLKEHHSQLFIPELPEKYTKLLDVSMLAVVILNS
ncbi:hypothetical protein SK128_007125, partial [Halocaridina rubra]